MLSRVTVYVFLAAMLVIVGCSNSTSEAADAKSAPAKKASPTATPTVAPAPKENVPASAAKEAGKNQPKAKEAQKPTPTYTVVRAWDFAQLPEDKWEWKFFSKGTKRTEWGAWFTTHQNTRVAQLPILDLNTADVDAVRLELVLRRKGPDGKPQDVPMDKAPIFWWVPKEQLPPAGQEPKQSAYRGRTFGKADPKKPNVYVAHLKNHKDWKGSVGLLVINVHVPQTLQESDIPYSVVVRRIEFLKQP